MKMFKGYRTNIFYMLWVITIFLSQESFAAGFRINLGAGTPNPANPLEEFRATGSDPRHRENELVRVESMRLVSGRGRRPRSEPDNLSGSRIFSLNQSAAQDLLGRFELVEQEAQLSDFPVSSEVVQELTDPQLNLQQETQFEAPQNPNDNSEFLLAEIEVPAEIPVATLETEIHQALPDPILIEEAELEVARIQYQEPAIIHLSHNELLIYSTYQQDNVTKENTHDLGQANIPSQAINHTNISTDGAEIKHAKIQTAQPVDFHGLTSHLTQSTSFRMATPMAGVAAGSEDLITYGFWASGFGTFGKQRDTSDEKRFKFIQKGVVVGADRFINDNMLLGFAYSNSAILRTYDTEDLMSNKQKVMSHIFSLYGSYKFNNPVYISGQLQYGKIHLKAKRHKFTNKNEYVYGETHGQMYGGKVEVGYNLNKIDDLYIIPKLSLSYNSSNLKAFNEKGTGVAFTFHDSMRSDRLAGSVGFEIRKKITSTNFNIVPSLYFTAEKVLTQKNGIVRISNEDLSINQMRLKTKGAKTEAFILGGKISTYHNRGYEVDLGYDLLLQSKYQSHTGSIKFKVNF